MQYEYDKEFFVKAVNTFKLMFNEIFDDRIILENIHCSFSMMGYFRMRYAYLPLDYTILVENEMRWFTIRITDKDGANIPLYRIEEFENKLSGNNIKNAILLLERVLNKNDFPLYLYKDKKLYKKIQGELKEVKCVYE